MVIAESQRNHKLYIITNKSSIIYYNVYNLPSFQQQCPACPLRSVCVVMIKYKLTSVKGL